MWKIDQSSFARFVEFLLSISPGATPLGHLPPEKSHRTQHPVLPNPNGRFNCCFRLNMTGRKKYKRKSLSGSKWDFMTSLTWSRLLDSALMTTPSEPESSRYANFIADWSVTAPAFLSVKIPAKFSEISSEVGKITSPTKLEPGLKYFSPLEPCPIRIYLSWMVSSDV